jgi:hypothetical protein
MSKLIEKEGKFYKECVILMLETEDCTNIHKDKRANSYPKLQKPSLLGGIWKSDSNHYQHVQATKQGLQENFHLYITSDDEIKEGDWFYDKLSTDKIYQRKNSIFSLPKESRKIIATTDTSLKLPIPEGLAEYPMSYTPKSLPQPSDKFIESYIDAHNKGGNIERVLVEYELFDEYGNIIMGDLQRESDTVRLKLKNDNIVIKKVKDSWSRDEVCNLLNEYRVYTWKNGSTANDLIKWIEENL